MHTTDANPRWCLKYNKTGSPHHICMYMYVYRIQGEAKTERRHMSYLIYSHLSHQVHWIAMRRVVMPPKQLHESVDLK